MPVLYSVTISLWFIVKEYIVPIYAVQYLLCIKFHKTGEVKSLRRFINNPRTLQTYIAETGSELRICFRKISSPQFLKVCRLPNPSRLFIYPTKVVNFLNIHIFLQQACIWLEQIFSQKNLNWYCSSFSPYKMMDWFILICSTIEGKKTYNFFLQRKNSLKFHSVR